MSDVEKTNYSIINMDVYRCADTGKYHRLDGPAVVFNTRVKEHEYWIQGVKYDTALEHAVAAAEYTANPNIKQRRF